MKHPIRNTILAGSLCLMACGICGIYVITSSLHGHLKSEARATYLMAADGWKEIAGNRASRGEPAASVKEADDESEIAYRKAEALKP